MGVVTGKLVPARSYKEPKTLRPYCNTHDNGVGGISPLVDLTGSSSPNEHYP
jgi:hypothetical protein